MLLPLGEGLGVGELGGANPLPNPLPEGEGERMHLSQTYHSSAFLNAALASRRVESKVGKGASSGRTIKGSSVHPSTTASPPRSFNLPATSLRYSREPSAKMPLTSSLKMISLILSRSASSGISRSILNLSKGAR